VPREERVGFQPAQASIATLSEKINATALDTTKPAARILRLALAVQLLATLQPEQVKEGRVRSPEEAELDSLGGSWTTSDRTHPGQLGSGGNSQGVASYRWEMDYKGLICDFRTDRSELGPYEVHGGVAYDAVNRCHS
jgi:hypothetical protein